MVEAENLFEKLCMYVSDNSWCWNLSCSTCGHKSFKRAFKLMAQGTDPSSEKGLRAIHAPTISVGGVLHPKPIYTFCESDKIAVIAQCMDSDISKIAGRCRFPDWLGYMGLILHDMRSESDEYHALSKEWAKQLAGLVERDSRAHEFLLTVSMVDGQLLEWTDLELCETSMRPEYRLL